MAIARDNSVDKALAASPSAANLLVSGSDRVLFCGTKGGDYSTGATYNGVSMTSLATNISDVGEYALTLYCLIAPSTGTNSLSVTVASGTIGWTAVSYTGADQTTQPDSTTTTNVDPSGTSITSSHTTTSDNAWVVGYFSGSRATLTESTGITFVKPQVNNVALGDSNGAVTPAGAYSMTTTMGSSGTMASIMAAVRPTGGGGGGATVYRQRHTLLTLGVG